MRSGWSARSASARRRRNGWVIERVLPEAVPSGRNAKALDVVLRVRDVLAEFADIQTLKRNELSV